MENTRERKAPNYTPTFNEMEQSYVSWFVALDFFAYLCPRLLNVFMYEEMKKVVFSLIVGQFLVL